MDSTIRMRACVRKTPIMLVLSLFWLWSIVVSAQDDPPTITVCNDCSAELEYSQAALWASELFAGQSEDVYVVNIPDGQTHVFRVTLTIVTLPSGDQSFEMVATQIAGEPGTIDDINEAVDIVKNFADAMVQDIPADDLELSPQFDSALDLIGPETGSAGLFRVTLENALTEYYGEFWRQQLLAVRDIVTRLIERFLPHAGPVFSQFVTVVFDDGTRVRIKIVSIGPDVSEPTKLIVEFSTDPKSVTAPGINGFPQYPGQVSAFSAAGVDADLSQALLDLMRRFEIDVVQNGHIAEDCETTWTCSLERCTVTVSC